MNKNKNLHNAKKAKKDEFYTLYEDIEKELKYYKEYLKDKIILCPADDYRKSNFCKYFENKFEEYGLKKVICIGYNKTGNGLFETGRGIVGEYDGKEWKSFLLQGNGDFRSKETNRYWEEANIVITNPPFSLFRDFIKRLQEFDKVIKDFIVIGNSNASSYKEVFPLFKDKLIRFGYTDIKQFIQPNGNLKNFGNIQWFTSLPVKNKKKLVLTKSYYENPNYYSKYDNYDAINVDKIKDIPYDYDKPMGVPITILEYNLENIEIIRFRKGNDEKDLRIDGKDKYTRIIIKLKEKYKDE